MPEQPDINPPQPTGLPPPARFSAGTSVQVKTNASVPGFENISLNGWSGTILDVDHGSKPPGYLVQWDQRTLAALSFDYRQRCKRDGLELDSVWLDENAIEAADREVSPVEQPTQLVPRPLSTDVQEDHLRAILGLTGNAPLPHRAAGSEIKFVKIFSFASQGLFSPDQVPAAPKPFWTTLFTTCVVGAIYGVVVGAAVAALEGAALAAQIVAILLGGGGCLLGAGYGFLFGAVNRLRRGPWLGGVLGATVAGMIGSLLGVMLIAFLGTVLGALAGGTLGRIVKRMFHKRLASIQGVIGGAMLGVAVQAWLHDADAAWSGAWMGGLAGASASLLLVIAVGLAPALLGKKSAEKRRNGGNFPP